MAPMNFQLLKLNLKIICILIFQHCSSKPKSKSPRRHRKPPSKAGRKPKPSSEPSKELCVGSTSDRILQQNSQFLIDSSVRGPAKIRDDEFVAFNATGHQVTTGHPDISSKSVSNVISSVNSSASSPSLLLSNSAYSQAESLFNNAIHSTNNVSSFSKPFPPSKGGLSSSSSSAVRSFKSSNSAEMNRTKVSEQKLLTSSSTRKFFKSEKKFESSRVRVDLTITLANNIILKYIKSSLGIDIFDLIF